MKAANGARGAPSLFARVTDALCLAFILVCVAVSFAPTSTSPDVPSSASTCPSTSLRVSLAVLLTEISTLASMASRRSACPSTSAILSDALSRTSKSILCAWFSIWERRRRLLSTDFSSSLKLFSADCTPACVRSTASIGISIFTVSATFIHRLPQSRSAYL